MASSSIADTAPAAAPSPLRLYGEDFQSRLLLGTSRYPTLETLQQAVQACGTQILTVALRRQDPGKRAGEGVWQYIRALECRLLPNTAGCHSAKEAVTTAHMAREIFATSWIKLEVIGDDYNLQPDPVETVHAAQLLLRDGFQVFPYCTDDLVLCRRLADAGCAVLMPWGAPIGTGRGLLNPYALEAIRARLPDTPLIIDAGLGRPSHAAQAMEMGYDAILLNSAVAQAADPPAMASAFRGAVEAGRTAYLAGLMPARQTARPSTPTLGTPFWRQTPNKHP